MRTTNAWIAAHGSIVLIVVGIGLVVLSFLTEAPASVPVAVIGAGAIILGVLLPRIEGPFKLGAHGLEGLLTRVEQESRASGLSPQQEAQAKSDALDLVNHASAAVTESATHARARESAVDERSEIEPVGGATSPITGPATDSAEAVADASKQLAPKARRVWTCCIESAERMGEGRSEVDGGIHPVGRGARYEEATGGIVRGRTGKSGAAVELFSTRAVARV